MKVSSKGVRVSVDVEPDWGWLGREFAAANSDEQAKFLQEAAVEFDMLEGAAADFQYQYVAGHLNETLKPRGRAAVARMLAGLLERVDG